MKTLKNFHSRIFDVIGLKKNNLYKFSLSKSLEDLGADPCHDTHADGHIGTVCDLHSNLGQRRPDGAHAEGDDIHGPASHAARKQIVHFRLQLVRMEPVAKLTLLILRCGY